MFTRVAAGESIRSVARWLTQSGIPTPRGAVVWNWGSLQRLLGHPIYKGVAPFGRYKRRHDENRARRGYKTTYRLVQRPQEEWIQIKVPAIVDETTWDEVQRRIKTNRSTLSGRADRKYMLSGLMRCPQCKEKMRAYRARRSPKKKDSEYYHLYECRCARPASNLKGNSCHNKQYRGYWAEPLVIRRISEFAHRPELASAAIAAYKSAQAQRELQPDTEQLQHQLADLLKQEQATVKAQIAGVMAGADPSVYESLLRDIAEKRKCIVEAFARQGAGEKQKATTDEAAIVTQAVAAVSEVFNTPDDELTPAEKQGLLARVIEAIYPEDTEGLSISLKPPLNINQSVAYFTTYR